MTPEKLIKKIARILEDLKIPYAITGGFAVAIWGKPRYTADIDIIIELLEKNIKPLAKKLLEIVSVWERSIISTGLLEISS